MRAYIITACVAAVAGAALGRALVPPRVEYRDRVHTVTVTKVERVRTRTTTKPDGTRVEERTETKRRADGDTRTDPVVLVPPAARWSASVLAGATPSLTPVYGGHVTYRLVGPLTVGAWGLGGGITAGGISAGVTW